MYHIDIEWDVDQCSENATAESIHRCGFSNIPMIPQRALYGAIVINYEEQIFEKGSYSADRNDTAVCNSWPRLSGEERGVK